jgi:tetratricopeptide (TPR) repeat protein
MAVYESEDRVRQRRAKSEQAISLAMKNRWDEAAQVNREILELFPNDVEAHNRLGKALTELGRYAEARDAYAQAVKLDPANGIAAKNLQRLTKLAEEGAPAAPPSPVDPRLFIEESGKTTVTQLTEVTRTDAVAKLAAGDQLAIVVNGKEITVADSAGERIGRIEPKLEQQLLQLLAKGNQYSATVTSASDQGVNVILRETLRSPSMGNRPSFRPSAAPEGAFRSYTREGILRYDVDEEDDEDLVEDEEETETETAPVDPDAVEETPLSDLAAEEDDVEENT